MFIFQKGMTTNAQTLLTMYPKCTFQRSISEDTWLLLQSAIFIHCLILCDNHHDILFCIHVIHFLSGVWNSMLQLHHELREAETEKFGIFLSCVGVKQCTSLQHLSSVGMSLKMTG